MTSRQDRIEGPEAHLEYGMKHVGYDADSEVNTYRDLQGNLWETKPGNQYGPLKMTYKATTKGQKKPSAPTDPNNKKGDYDFFQRKRSTSNASSLSNNTPAPPPYTQRSRRFTSFDMLDKQQVASESQGLGGVLGSLGRSLSVRKANNTSYPQRRSTVSTSNGRGPMRHERYLDSRHSRPDQPLEPQKNDARKQDTKQRTRRATVASTRASEKRWPRGEEPIREADEDTVMGKLGKLILGRGSENVSERVQRSRSVIGKPTGR
jgi:hypothetical protein